MAEYDRGVGLVLRFFEGLQPLNPRGCKNMNNGRGLDQLEVSCVADAAAVFRLAAV